MRQSRMLTLLVVCLTAGGALAQVVRTQSGRLLDRSYLIGSLGVNSVRRADRYIDGNLLVTGQVTGGFEFRGGAPYAGANQLRLELPSAGFDNFIRSSAGLDRVRSLTSPYRPSPYLSRQRTVLGPAGIVGGQTGPGTSAPLSAYVPPPQARRLVDSAVEAYRPMLPELSRRLRIDTRVELLADASPEQRLRRLSRTADPQAGAFRPAASALFGIVRKEDRRGIEEELTEAEAARRERSPGGPVDARVETGAAAPGPVTGREPPAEGLEIEPGEAAPRKLPETGQDVFVDILVGLKRIRQAEEQTPPEQPPKAPPPRAVERAKPGETPEQAQQRAQRAQRAKLRAAVERLRGKLVVHSLAGEGKDLVNVHLTRAERLLAKGKYYEAADWYDLADVITRSTNPRDPRAPLGAALAFFAAYEPLTAAFYLEQGMKRFPPLMMEIDVNVSALLKDEVVRKRLGQLETRIAEAVAGPEASLVFLAAFIRSAAGDRDKAAEHARVLKKIAADNELFRTYAQYLLTGKIPTAPASRPASAPKGS